MNSKFKKLLFVLLTICLVDSLVALEIENSIDTIKRSPSDTNLKDIEAISYIASDNSLWVADDAKKQIYRVNLNSQRAEEVIGGFNGIKRGSDIKAIAYDNINDILYVFARRNKTVFKLTRESGGAFSVVEHKRLNKAIHGAVFINNRLFVSYYGLIKEYTYETNQISHQSIFRSRKSIHDMAYSDDILWIITSDNRLHQIDFNTMTIVQSTDMGTKGLVSARGVEVVRDKLYVADGADRIGGDLEHAIYIFDIGDESTPPPPPSDTTAPTITLNGENPLTLTVGDNYNELGASAVDDIDGEVTVSISGEVDNSLAGTYTITYSASDSSNNQASATRTVYVEEETPPPTQQTIIGAREVISTPIERGTIFISSTGTGEECSIETPCELEKGIQRAEADDVVFFKGGVYDLSTIENRRNRVVLNEGLRGRPIIYESYPNELAIFDGSNLPDDAYGSIYMKSYSHLRRVEIRNMIQSGVKIVGNHNIVEGVESHHNQNSGILVYKRRETQVNDTRTSYNIIRDCIIHHNSDVDTVYKGGNADGISLSYGVNNLVTHNTVYSNSDDGIDTWKTVGTTVEYSISYDNGKGENGNGKGFKLGGDNTPSSPLGRGVVSQFNIAYNNKSTGFTENSGKEVTMKNNISYNNGEYGFVSFDGGSSLINNISYNNTLAHLYSIQVPNSNNSWQIKEVVESDFLSLNPTSENFLKPKESSAISDIGAYYNAP